ncbi:MAG: hypothetical protein J6Z45_02835 [Oscillospiraceae bacterium]|nr:hypothetical protein [Oscillospiraceae bacterium]
MSFWKRLFGRGKQKEESFEDPAYDVEAMTQALAEWEEKHFPQTAKSRKKPEYRYQVYYTDSGREISLKSVRFRTEEEPVQDNSIIPNLVRELLPLFGISGTPLSSVLRSERDTLSAVLASYQEQRQRLQTMSPQIRQDPFFQTIRQVIYMKLRIMFNELSFLQSDRLTDMDYIVQCLTTFRRLMNDLRDTNSKMGDYLLALSRMEYEDVSRQLEEIRCGASAMLDVANQQIGM